MNSVLANIKATESTEYGSNTSPVVANTSAIAKGTSTSAATGATAAKKDTDEEEGSYEMEADDSPVAGMKSARHDQAPAFYAWPINYVGK